MKPEHWQQIEQLYHAALERAPEERAAFLDAACDGDRTVQQEVESLLAYDERAAHFITTPPNELATEILAATQSPSLLGHSLAHYQIISRLGKGGMGEVYLAEDTRLRRKVALNELLPQVYDELRRLAEHYLRGERPEHTLQPSDLVHETYLRLVDEEAIDWQNRAHFFGIAAVRMRHILVEHARSRQAAKRGGGEYRLSLSEAERLAEKGDVNLLALDEALHRLEVMDQQKSRIVELRYFGGLTIEETAEALQISPTTVKRDWRLARAWLRNEISQE